MAICKLCQDPAAAGYGTSHLGLCDNIPPASGQNVGAGYAALMHDWKSPEERGVETFTVQTETPFGSREVLQFRPAARNNVCIGANIDMNGQHNCVLIGRDLKADHPFQLKIGNSVVEASRELTREEFDTLMTMARHLTAA